MALPTRPRRGDWPIRVLDSSILTLKVAQVYFMLLSNQAQKGSFKRLCKHKNMEGSGFRDQNHQVYRSLHALLGPSAGSTYYVEQMTYVVHTKTQDSKVEL